MKYNTFIIFLQAENKNLLKILLSVGLLPPSLAALRVSKQSQYNTFISVLHPQCDVTKLVKIIYQLILMTSFVNFHRLCGVKGPHNTSYVII